MGDPIPINNELKIQPPQIKLTSRLLSLLRSSDPTSPASSEEDSPRTGTNTGSPSFSSSYSFDHLSLDGSPNSPSTPSSISAPSPFAKSPWLTSFAPKIETPKTGLVASLTRTDGHIYSLAACGDLLYTGSDSKNIRVWKDCTDFSGFKSSSGLVKAIVIAGDNRIFTGHQDGKVRIWRLTSVDGTHKHVGMLPRLKDALRLDSRARHRDPVSCLSLDEEAGLLYSGSWDRTIKVWRLSDSSRVCSVAAHEDAINAVAVGFEGMVLSGSADGTVKAWRREGTGGNGATKYVMERVLMSRESAVTALAVAKEEGTVYCGTSDGAVNFWEGGRMLEHGGSLRWHRKAVLCLAVAEGSLVVSGSADGSVRVWRRVAVGSHEKVAVLRGHSGPVKCLAVKEQEEEEFNGPDGLDGPSSWVVYSGSLDKSVKVWRVADGRGS